MNFNRPKVYLFFGGMAAIGILVLLALVKALSPQTPDVPGAEPGQDLGDRVVRNDPLITFVPDADAAAQGQSYSEPIQTIYSPEYGPKDAPIEIFEFGDFECPACRTFSAEMSAVLDRFPNQIHLVWKDFPIPRVHPNAADAAEFARCANEQGRFWDVYDHLFLNQYALGADLYTSLADELGLDADAIAECLISNYLDPFIQQDFVEGKALGLNEVPAIFINGTRYTGSMTANAISDHIQSLINE